MREEMKQLAKDSKVRVKDVLALTPTYDPFYMGSPSDHKKALWAMELFEWVSEKWDDRKDELREIGIWVGTDPHLRALHYLQATGRPNPMDWRGNPYRGTFAQWKELGECFKRGKVLTNPETGEKYIPFGVIEDHKHPAVDRNLYRMDDSEYYGPDDGEISEEIGLDRLRFRTNIDTSEYHAALWEMERLNIQHRIPVHMELLTEKKRELVDIVAAEYWVNVQNGVGQLTYEPVYSLLKRAIEDSEGRPIRLFYLSDFDVRGEMTMPVGVARLIEWMLYELPEFQGLDIRLKKLILTKDQVEEYDLPSNLGKENDTMLPRWKEMYGDRLCELDAIDTLFATTMVEILRNEFSRYIPDEMKEYFREANEEFDALMSQFNSAVDEAIVREQFALHEAVEAKVAEVLKDFKYDFEIDVSDELEELENFYFEEPDWDIDDGDGDWLYDSSRPYGEQLVKYKEVRGW